jgi:hypothetical protein
MSSASASASSSISESKTVVGVIIPEKREIPRSVKINYEALRQVMGASSVEEAEKKIKITDEVNGEKIRRHKIYTEYWVGEKGNIYIYNYIVREYLKVNTTFNKNIVCVNIKHKSVEVRRMVAETWIENPNNYTLVLNINRDPTDNRKENLIWSSYRDNIMIAQKRKRTKLRDPSTRTTSVYKGVCRTQQGKWVAQHYCDKKLFARSYHFTEIEAAHAYNMMVIEAGSQLVRLNDVDETVQELKKRKIIIIDE